MHFVCPRMLVIECISPTLSLSLVFKVVSRNWLMTAKGCLCRLISFKLATTCANSIIFLFIPLGAIGGNSDWEGWVGSVPENCQICYPSIVLKAVSSSFSLHACWPKEWLTISIMLNQSDSNLAVNWCIPCSAVWRDLWVSLLLSVPLVWSLQC